MNNFLHGVFFVSFTHVLLFLDTLRFSKWIYFQGCSGPLEGRGVLWGGRISQGGKPREGDSMHAGSWYEVGWEKNLQSFGGA